jgi:hypothetical protein
VLPVQEWPPGQIDGASRPATGQNCPIGQGKTAELLLRPGQNPPAVHVFARAIPETLQKVPLEQPIGWVDIKGQYRPAEHKIGTLVRCGQ